MNNLTLKVPLTPRAHLQAQNSCVDRADPDHVKKNYLNSLAVYAVNYYLNCLGFSTDLAASDSSNPSFQLLSDTADLMVNDCGKIECRPVLPEAETCNVPPEVWTERIGYIAVQFDRELSEANLIGFLPAVSSEEVPLEQFHSLEALLDVLHQPLESPASSQTANPSIPVRLNRWLEGVLDAGWQTVEELLVPEPEPLAFSFRRSPAPLSQDVNPVKAERVKFLNFENRHEQVALVVKLIEENSADLYISVEILPRRARHLPPDARLVILDENNRAALQAEAGSSEGMEIQFSGELGERFSIEVILGESKAVEPFIV